jgi:hypothetical protein
LRQQGRNPLVVAVRLWVVEHLVQAVMVELL